MLIFRGVMTVGIYLALANLSCGILCFLMALMFRRNKNAANYIAGYNMMSEKEKASYNETELRRFLSNRLFFYSALMFVSGIPIAFNIYAWVILIGSWSIFIIVFIHSLTHLKYSARLKVKGSLKH